MNTEMLWSRGSLWFRQCNNLPQATDELVYFAENVSELTSFVFCWTNQSHRFVDMLIWWQQANDYTFSFVLCSHITPGSTYPPQSCFPCREYIYIYKKNVIKSDSEIHFYLSQWCINILQTCQMQLYTISLLSCHQHITMERRRVNALAVHPGATPTWRVEWREEGGGGRGGSSSLSIRRDAPQPQWTTRQLGLHR